MKTPLRDPSGQLLHELQVPMLGGKDERLLDLPKIPKPEIKQCDECGVSGFELREERDVFGQPFSLCDACWTHNQKALVPPRNEKEHPSDRDSLFSSWAQRLLEEADRVRAA